VIEESDKEAIVGDDWNSLQAHRKVFGVIGIALCAEYPDLSLAMQHFQKAVYSSAPPYPHLLATKCFAFEVRKYTPLTSFMSLTDAV
jgi:hypothetical protein